MTHARSRSDPPVAEALPEAPWSRPPAEVVGELGVDPETGLPPAEARRRLQRWGPNELQEHARRSLLAILVAQFRSVVVALLGAAAVLSFFFGGPVEAAAIVVVLLLNAAIGFVTELRALKSMESLRELGTVEVTVVRDGRPRRIPAERLVPGDVVLVEGGDVVSADLRLVEASRLQANESVLTGESVPVEKSLEAVGEDVPVAERPGMLFRGTAVTRGSGRGVVTATGMRTELGEIATLVEAAEEEITPLEERLNRMGQRLVWVTLALAALIIVSGLAVGKDPYLIVETGIALAVAAIPEGLPIVATLALARGMWRMARRNALVERLSAVETLGSTTVILTDKTGTLTENRMTVTRVALPGADLELDRDSGRWESRAGGAEPRPDDGGVGAGGDGAGGVGGATALPEAAEAGLRGLLSAAVLCNNASLTEEAEAGTAPGPAASRRSGDRADAGPTPYVDRGVGDPTEVALLAAGAELGLRRRELLDRHPEDRELAFDSATRMMATVHRGDRKWLVAVKGAPEAVLEACTRERGPDGDRPLAEERRPAWEERNRELAASGLRVLAVATRDVDDPDADPYEDLTLLGLVGMVDPPRRDVRPALEACYGAGMRVVVVTGDQPETARYVAEAVGLRPSRHARELEVLAGSEIRRPDGLGPEETRRLRDAVLFARAEPAQKMDLLHLHQQEGEVVAMIGDGVNDAPALRKADIGVAMGQRGTQVAREAADMVLQDDRMATIVAAVEQGRVIFDNIRKFVVYLLSCNASEILAVSLATLANAPLPVLPLQILFLNLVTDVFPALALGASEGDPTVMDRPPRDPDEGVLVRRHWTVIVSYGTLLTVVVLAALALGLGPLGLSTGAAVTLSFLTLALAQLLHVFNMVEPEAGTFVNEVTRNRWVWGAVALCGALLAAVVYVSPLARVLQVEPPGAAGWAVVLGLSTVPLLLGRVGHTVLHRWPSWRAALGSPARGGTGSVP